MTLSISDWRDPGLKEPGGPNGKRTSGRRPASRSKRSSRPVSGSSMRMSTISPLRFAGKGRSRTKWCREEWATPKAQFPYCETVGKFDIVKLLYTALPAD